MQAQEHIGLLRKLINLDTVGGNEGLTAKLITDYLDGHGIASKSIEVEPGRYNVVAEVGDGDGPVLAFEGHQDVVALGDRTKWHHDPFGGEIVKSHMYGRGTSDMKSGLAAAIIALVEIKESQKPIHGKIRLLVTIGEESSSVNHMQGAQYFSKHGYVDDVTGMIVAEPSGLPLSWLKSNHPRNPYQFTANMIAQLTNNNSSEEQYVLNYAHKGSVTYEIHSLGKTAHSSTPELGIDAIVPLIQIIADQNSYFDSLTAVNPVLGKTVAVTTKIEGGTQLNSVPSSASIYVKVRTIPEVKNDDIISSIERIVNKNNLKTDAKLSFNLLGNKYPVMSNKNDKLITLLRKIGESRLSQSLPLGGAPGGTDAAEFVKTNPNISVAVFGPGNLTAHQVDEYVNLDSFESFIDIYKQTACEYF